MTRPNRWAARVAAGLLLLLGSPLAGEQPAPPPAVASVPAPVPSVQPARPALWKVADADTTIWLFGTVHVLPAGIEWYQGPVAGAFEGSDLLVTEIVDPGAEAMARLITEVAARPEGTNLRDSLPPDTRAAYERALAGLRVPETAFDGNDAWYASVILSTVPLFEEGYVGANGVDQALGSRAAARKLAHVGLETAEQQFGIFDRLPEKVQQRYLSEVVAQLPGFRDELRAMVEAWRTGNADELARIMNKDETDPTLMKAVLIDRNKAWAKWIRKRLDQPGTVFVAVGAGHLAGSESVQAFLGKAGIETQRVQ